MKNNIKKNRGSKETSNNLMDYEQMNAV